MGKLLARLEAIHSALGGTDQQEEFRRLVFDLISDGLQPADLRDWRRWDAYAAYLEALAAYLESGS